ncbi:hypothetical protein GSI_11549 [Ganoderma sinense ZZ0214-1]|uniref:Uncharacterized protein n=1 Tax=Ganoderma sinense ZZ0214-1 TaxID=1077348 RepID=A0A2G8RWA9_9APHY|nr:hypothetical protein GSI_11549 [Ganoderma sinense ZZ0214-1]
MELNVPVTFPRLRILTVLSGRFTPIHALIGHMDAPQLHTLSMTESYTSTTQTHVEMQTILRPLVVKCPLLTAFKWKSTKVQVQPRPVDGALAELIDPLLSHLTLQSFSAHFHGGGAVRCTPADFRMIAEAWPDLEFFHLCDTGHRLANQQYADLESLLVFARRCPHLRSLHLPDVEFSVDANLKSIRATVEGSSTSTSPGRTSRPHGLRELRVMRSVGCSEELTGDADHLEVEAWRRWVEDVFPFAAMRGTLALGHRSGWARFQEYASLVREIVIDPLINAPYIRADILQDTFWSQLSSSSHPEPILPHLERAAIRSTKIPWFIDMGVLRLLNPSIRELDIQVVSAQAAPLEHPQLEKALATCFSSIKSLEVFSIEVPNLARILDIESLPRSRPRLRYLKLNDRASSIEPSLRPLAALANLKYLHINFCHSECVTALNYPLITLTGLRTLAVSCYELAAISNLLDYVKAPRLQTFSVYKMYRDANSVPLALQELSRHLGMLVAKCPSLTTFEWSTGSTQAGSIAVRRVGHLSWQRAVASLSEFFAPLLSHRAMRNFSVQFSGGPVVPYTRTDFRAIAEAWPDLETFRLYDREGAGSSASNRRERPSQCADLECVFVLVHHCLHLRVLHIGRMQFVSGAFGTSLTRCSTEPHHMLRELCVDHVVCAREWCEDGEVHHRKAVMQLCYLMAEAFPSAVIQIGGLKE